MQPPNKIRNLEATRRSPNADSLLRNPQTLKQHVRGVLIDVGPAHEKIPESRDAAKPVDGRPLTEAFSEQQHFRPNTMLLGQLQPTVRPLDV